MSNSDMLKKVSYVTIENDRNQVSVQTHRNSQNGDTSKQSTLSDNDYIKVEEDGGVSL